MHYTDTALLEQPCSLESPDFLRNIADRIADLDPSGQNELHQYVDIQVSDDSRNRQWKSGGVFRVAREDVAKSIEASGVKVQVYQDTIDHDVPELTDKQRTWLENKVAIKQRKLPPPNWNARGHFQHLAQQYPQLKFLPLQPGMKIPLKGGHGYKDATNNIGDIYGFKRNCNYGLRTGAESGVIVIDIDDRDLTNFRSLVAKHGDLPVTPIAKTGRGYHIYLQLPDGVNPRTVKFKSLGIDIMSEGNYVMIPPSVTANGERKWLVSPDNQDFATIPDSWLQFVLDKQNKEPKEGAKPKKRSKPQSKPQPIVSLDSKRIEKSLQAIAATAYGQRYGLIPGFCRFMATTLGKIEESKLEAYAYYWHSQCVCRGSWEQTWGNIKHLWKSTRAGGTGALDEDIALWDACANDKLDGWVESDYPTLNGKRQAREWNAKVQHTIRYLYRVDQASEGQWYLGCRQLALLLDASIATARKVLHELRRIGFLILKAESQFDPKDPGSRKAREWIVSPEWKRRVVEDMCELLEKWRLARKVGHESRLLDGDLGSDASIGCSSSLLPNMCLPNSSPPSPRPSHDLSQSPEPQSETPETLKRPPDIPDDPPEEPESTPLFPSWVRDPSVEEQRQAFIRMTEAERRLCEGPYYHD